MKMAKRICIALLALAVLVPCFAVFASAQTPAITEENFKDILEYYEAPVMLVENFEAGTLGAAYDNDAFTPPAALRGSALIAGTDEGKYLEITAEKLAATSFKYLVQKEVDGETVPDPVAALGVSFDYYSAPTATGTTGGSKVNIGVYGTAGEAKKENVALFAISTYLNQEGVSLYNAADGLLVKNETFVPAVSTWYSISLFMDGSEGVMSVQVTEKETGTVKLSTSVSVDFSDFHGFQLTCPAANMRNSVTRFDNLEVYGGSFPRVLSAKQQKTEEAVIGCMALYKTTEDEEVRTEILALIDKLITKYGFTTQDTDCKAAIAEYDRIVAEIETARLYDAAVLEMRDAVERAAFTTYYTAKKAELAACKDIIDAFGEQYADKMADDEVVQGYIARYNAMNAAMEEDDANVQAYIAAVNAIKDAQNFNAKKSAVAAAKALKAEGDISGVPGVTDANIALSNAETEVNCLEGYSLQLINAVKDLRSAQTLGERRVLLKKAINAKDGAESTYDGVSAAKTELDAAVAQYNADVAALNSAFSGALESTATVVSAAAPVGQVVAAVGVLKKFFA